MVVRREKLGFMFVLCFLRAMNYMFSSEKYNPGTKKLALVIIVKVIFTSEKVDGDFFEYLIKKGIFYVGILSCLWGRKHKFNFTVILLDL